MKEIVQVLPSIFECVKKENNDIDFSYKRFKGRKNDLISDLKADISTLEKKIDSINVEIDNINQYEQGVRR